tara:strand:- start:64 stop:600 length:537 start_codon:yes stop_codon:yes gene_type:complete
MKRFLSVATTLALLSFQSVIAAPNTETSKPLIVTIHGADGATPTLTLRADNPEENSTPDAYFQFAFLPAKEISNIDITIYGQRSACNALMELAKKLSDDAGNQPNLRNLIIRNERGELLLRASSAKLGESTWKLKVVQLPNAKQPKSLISAVLRLDQATPILKFREDGEVQTAALFAP